MKKNNKNAMTLIKIIVLFIFICLLYNNNLYAGTDLPNSFQSGEQLWDKSNDGYNIYCVAPNLKFKKGTYSVTEKYKITNNQVERIDGGQLVNEKLILKRAYILSESDNTDYSSLLSKYIDDSPLSSENTSAQNSVKNGIYNVLCYKQEALWKLSGEWKWDDSSTLTYHWDFGVSKDNKMRIKKVGSIYQFKGSNNNNGDYWRFIGRNGVDIDLLETFGNGTDDYYEKAKKLYDDATEYVDNYYSGSSEVTYNGNSLLDYSDPKYVIVGKYTLEYSDSINFDKDSYEVTVIKNGAETKINKKNNRDQIKLEWNDKTVTIKVLKGEISSIKNIKWKYSYNVLNGYIYTYNLNGGSESVQPVTISNCELSEKEFDFNIDISINLIPPVQVNLNKVDTASPIGSAVKGAQFKIEYSNGLAGGTATSNSSGEVKFPQVQPAGPDEFTATITETSTPAGYKPLEKPIKLKFTYDESSAKWEVTKIENESDENAGTPSVTNSSGTNVVNLTVTNKSIIEKLTLLKISTVTELGAVEGAKFKLTLTNVESIKGYTLPTTGEPKTIIVTTNSSGQIVLEDIVIVDLNNDVTITITETEAPKGYKKIEGTITLTLRRQGNDYTISETKDDTVTDDEYKTGKVTETNHELTLKIKDIPIMNLGGIVWVEKEKTGKTPSSNDVYGDGKEDGTDEEALGGVTVKLYKGTTKIAETISSDGNAQATYKNNKGESITVTLKQGEYMFTDIEAGNDYHVEFEYDGILYKALLNTNAYTTTKDSKIKVEPNRDDFNKATTAISGSGEVDKSTTNNGWTIEYDTKSQSNKALYTGVYEGTTQQFVKAKTDTYLKETKDWLNTWNNDGTINTSHYAFNINCGLCEKYFDLNLGTDVASATVKINGQETTYTYDQILDGKLNEALNKSSESTVDYNLYLAYSDYYYRIDDYKVPSNGNSLGSPYGESLPDKKDANTELEIYVTYKLVLNNQSTHNATVDLVEYRYDSKYEFDVYDDNCKIDNAYIIDNNNNVLKLYTGNYSNDGKEIVSGNQKNIYITFKVKENGEQKCVLNTDYLNQAEILQYTTEEGGLVDADSAPGNAFIEHDADPEKPIRYEDDTDEANGIKITFKKDAERSISGKVFDDDNANKDGVNDVIVQLIELIEINGKQYEYIWQETVAGSNTVKTTSTSDKNGGKGNPYTVENGIGEYQFTQGIIPGNYIVRFIYGDGTTYDLTDNVKTYNGEDYKSTYVDYNYNAEWYNTETLTGESSKAVDNEARRLKVMSYAVDVDKEKGAKLAKLDGDINIEDLKDVLDNTWMCAETLKIKMTVDTNDKTTTSEKASVPDGTSPKTENTQFTNVNFGLMKRPQTKLVLEKHITGLTVKPVASGVNLIANATADIDKILELSEGAQITLEGQQDGLSAFKAGRNNRNMWYLQTDTTELAQGADAYITYTYVVKNEGDTDYLNEDLVDFYEAVGVNEYKNKLLGLETEVKDAKKGKSFTNGTYISEFYYTGAKGTNDKEVLASVEEIQEALNPKVKFVDSTTDFNKKDRILTDKYAYYDTNGDLQNESKITEIITSKTGTGKLLIGSNDTSKKLVVSVGLSASEIENTGGGVFDSYIAEITHYTNAAGRRDQSTPANLSYVHSYDTNKTLTGNNEEDEFWAETFRITKPTGEDKLTPVQIAIITVTSVAVLGIGIILIKKFVLKK